jgi:hypothetical protein
MLNPETDIGQFVGCLDVDTANTYLAVPFLDTVRSSGLNPSSVLFLLAEISRVSFLSFLLNDATLWRRPANAGVVCARTTGILYAPTLPGDEPIRANGTPLTPKDRICL